MPLYSKNYCRKHFRRYQRHGTTEIKLYERHGMTNSSEYQSWHGMKSRCYCEGHVSYSRYGGRGIKVCDEWKTSFMAFYKDMGPKPFINAQIDRIDNDGNYEPNNCRWATPLENARNKDCLKLNIAKVKTIKKMLKEDFKHMDIAKKYNISPSTIYDIYKQKTWEDV